MLRRSFLPLFLFGVRALAIEPEAGAVRGKLIGGPAIHTAGGQSIALSGDDPTMAVLGDSRLTGVDLEARGHTTAPGQFAIDKIHTRSLFAYKNGKKLMVTYWCDVCYIRTFSPGVCWCCQDYTKLDLIDPDKVVKE